MSHITRRDRRRRLLFDALEDKVLLDGALDPAFGSGGKTTVDFGPANTVGRPGDAQATVVLNDGSILVGSTNAYGGPIFLAKLKPNGTLDASFGTGGKETLRFGPNSFFSVTLDTLLAQPDGKIIVAGNYSGQFAVARLNPNGSLDMSFGTGGKLLLSYATNGSQAPTSAALQSDGKILLAGSVTIPTQNSAEDFAVIRLTSTGALDTSFNGTGKQQVPFDLTYAGVDRATSVTQAADGKVVLAGYAAKVPGNYTWAVARLTPTGALDTSFNGSGKQILPLTGYGTQVSVATMSDGRVVLAGSDSSTFISKLAVARLTVGGALDTTFSGSGFEEVALPGTTAVSPSASNRVLALQKDGKLVVAASARVDKNLPNQSGSDYDFAVVRLGADGKLDTTFNTTGYQTIPFDLQQGTFPSNQDTGGSVAIQADGNIVVAGVALTGIPSLGSIGAVAGVARLIASPTGPPPPPPPPTGTQATTTGLAVSATAVAEQQAVTLTATVSPALASGKVQFLDGGLPIGSRDLTSGTASFTTVLAKGQHNLTAQYLGDSVYAPSTSSAVGVTVGTTSQTPTSVNLSASTTSAQSGQPVTFTATVSPLFATGQVQFLDGTTVLGVANLSAGSAVYTTSALGSGLHHITAVYLGTVTYAQSTSNTVDVNEGVVFTSLLLGLSATTLAPGQALVMTATIAPSSATGQVRFLDGNTLLGVAQLSGGRATLSVTSLGLGSHSIWAFYDGNSSNGHAQTPTQTVVVNNPSTARTPPRVQSVSLTRGARPSIRIVFTQAVNAAMARDVRDYVMRTLGKKGHNVPVVRVAYAAASHAVTLTLQGRFTASDAVRLVVRASGIVNAKGVHLDGNGDGRPGDNYDHQVA
jgi:uncharacterized delta-60 repeat protein